MKFAFCLYRYFPFGGLQRDFLRIAKECVRRGHSVDVFTMLWEGEKDPDLNIHIVPTSGWQNHTRAQHFATQLQTHFTETRYDLIVGFNKMPGLDVYYAADTCYQAKAREKHGILYRLTPRYRHLVNYENAVFNKHAHTDILLISSLQQPEFMSLYQTQEKRFHLLPPGIARDRIAPPNAEEIRTQTRQEFHISENEFLLLMVGSGFKTKGLDRTLTALAALPEGLKSRCHLFIIGKDSSSAFKKQAQQLGILNRVQFLGGRDDVARFLLAADLLLHPAYNENTGTVLLEALVSGLPVLTTDVCGYAHYIEEAQAGCVIPSPFQQKQFNQTLHTMLLSPEQTHWRTNGLAFAKQADLYSMSERATDTIESLALR
jgi:UDP-glucose:(heptosyl)LPS alpha-1,3-glucosyltransferase